MRAEARLVGPIRPVPSWSLAAFELHAQVWHGELTAACERPSDPGATRVDRRRAEPPLQAKREPHALSKAGLAENGCGVGRPVVGYLVTRL